MSLRRGTTSPRGVAQIKDGGVWLKDGDTPNGTWILGRAYSEKRLQQGDRIKCGSTTFLYLEHEDSENTLLDIINNETDRNRQVDTLRADYSVRGDAAVYYKEVSKVFVEMAKSLNAVLDIAELQVRLLDLAFEMIPALRGAILLNGHRVSPDPGDFVSQIFRERGFDGVARFTLSSKVLDEVYTSRRPSITNNVSPVLCAPLIVSGAMRGVLYLLAAAEHAWQVRGDNLGVEIDTRTGKVVAQHAILWPPSSFRIQSGRLYAFTVDGHAYAMSAP